MQQLAVLGCSFSTTCLWLVGQGHGIQLTHPMDSVVFGLTKLSHKKTPYVYKNHGLKRWDMQIISHKTPWFYNKNGFKSLGKVYIFKLYFCQEIEFFDRKCNFASVCVTEKFWLFPFGATKVLGDQDNLCNHIHCQGDKFRCSTNFSLALRLRKDWPWGSFP